MKKPNNYDKAQEYTPAKKLPAGAYICQIMNVEEQTNDYGTKLILAFDIVEGEFKDFYKEQYGSQTQEDKKWKGNFRIACPDDNAEENDWKLRMLKSSIHKFEDSNQGYHWDWDEQKLKGLKVGILVRDKEYDYEGRHGFWSEPFALITVDDVKNGNFEVPETKYLDNNNNGNNASASIGDGFMNIPDNVDDGGLPFNF